MALQYPVDVDEPLLLVGNCNDWGRDLDDARRRFTFAPAGGLYPGSGQRESRLQLEVAARKLSFQVVSARRLWEWRVYPTCSGAGTKELRHDHKTHACLGLGKHDNAAHGRNFNIKEAISKVIEITVLLSKHEGIRIWYTRLGSNALSAALGHMPQSKPEYSLPEQSVEALEEADRPRTVDEIEPLRLCGRFCQWDLDAPGLTFNVLHPLAGPMDGRRRYYLCFRMQSNEARFQIVSGQLGLQWRLYPKKRGVHGRTLLPGHDDSLEVVEASGRAGHGKYFRVREPFLTVVTLCVAIEEATCDTGGGPVDVVGKVHVSYTVEDSCVQVAVGMRDFQYPPGPVTNVDLLCREIILDPRVREKFLKLDDGVRKINDLAEHMTNIRALSLEAITESSARVAAMLMLRPNVLGSHAFRTYLWYHLLAPGGPRFAHIFVFVDEPPRATEDAANGEDSDAGDDEVGGGLARWLRDSAEAKELRPCVSLLDGGNVASARAPPSTRPAGLDEKVRAAAFCGEILAKQMLNMERCLEMAVARSIDWLLCNLDADEALVCRGSVGQLLAAVPDATWQVNILNHEAVPQAVGPPVSFFQECTLFKRNQLLMPQPTREQVRCMMFWGARAALAAADVGSLVGDCPRAPLKPTEAYFTGYFNGKSAVRVGALRAAGAFSEDIRCWSVPEASVARLGPERACILHYHNCQGVDSMVRKYSARATERWNHTRFHNFCQRLFLAGGTALGDYLERGLVVHEEDGGEVEAQLAAGVCLRITEVSDACAGRAPWCRTQCGGGLDGPG